MLLNSIKQFMGTHIHLQLLNGVPVGVRGHYCASLAVVIHNVLGKKLRLYPFPLGFDTQHLD